MQRAMKIALIFYTEMNFKEQLLEVANNLQCDTFTDRLLCKKIGIYSTFEKKEVTKALEELVADGELLSFDKGEYSLATRSRAVKGIIKGNRRGFGFLIRSDGGADLFIPHKGLHEAQHGDTVYAMPVRGTKDEAYVVSVIARGRSEIVGTYTCDRAGRAFVVPDDDNYYSDIYVPSAKKKGARNNDKVNVKIVSYDTGKNPEGEVIEILGKADTVKGDTLSIIRDHGFCEYFPTEVLREAERLDKPVDLRAIGRREDYRNLLTITIDGEDARDFDDAISIEKKDDRYVLYVHIADVSDYIKQDSVLDVEALKRATSVYLPNMVLPMLPPAISNGVCSLNEGVDRLTLSCVMDVDFSGKVVANKLVEAVIRSNHRMTYTNVTKILNGDEEKKKEYADILDMLGHMHELQGILSAKRAARGSINFINDEPKITLDENGKVLNVEPYPYDRSNLIIEEFMLLANETVAEFMYHTELPFVYRVHEAPQKEKLKVFSNLAKAFGYNFPIRQTVHPTQFQELLDEIAGTPEEGIISKVMLRSMQKAKYTVNNLGHFGLALDYYCHFTSPIRRYPDLMIHRVIKAMLAGRMTGGAIPKTQSVCERAAAVSSEREIAAEMAERDADDYFKMLFMEDKIGEVYDGIISGVTNFGLFVQLQNTVECMISTDKLPKAKYEFNETRYNITGGGRVFALGDKIKIKVDSVSRDIRRINFTLYEEE